MKKNNNFDQIVVNNQDTFVEFLRLFRENLAKNSSEWENGNLNDFLEAMERYTEDIQGFYDNTRQIEDAKEASWKRFADIMRGARIYE
jgi:hypothetical protein